MAYEWLGQIAGPHFGEHQDGFQLGRLGVELSLEGRHLLVAGGRTPNTSGIGLEKAGVETTERGHVKVNERLQTTAEGVWAVGDCAGSPHFTHISEDDFAVVIETESDRILGFAMFALHGVA